VDQLKSAARVEKSLLGKQSRFGPAKSLHIPPVNSNQQPVRRNDGMPRERPK
jgi:hypothetical protein